MKERMTKQKKIILETLENDMTHPTVQELYQKIKQKDSRIGQATVYRNVNRLVEEGKVLKLSLGNGIDHYDGHTHLHYHFYCSCCQKIYDLEKEDDYISKRKLEEKYEIKINQEKIIFEGICKGCLNEKI